MLTFFNFSTWRLKNEVKIITLFYCVNKTFSALEAFLKVYLKV